MCLSFREILIANSYVNEATIILWGSQNNIASLIQFIHIISDNISVLLLSQQLIMIIMLLNIKIYQKKIAHNKRIHTHTRACKMKAQLNVSASHDFIF